MNFRIQFFSNFWSILFKPFLRYYLFVVHTLVLSKLFFMSNFVLYIFLLLQRKNVKVPIQCKVCDCRFVFYVLLILTLTLLYKMYVCVCVQCFPFVVKCMVRFSSIYLAYFTARSAKINSFISFFFGRKALVPLLFDCKKMPTTTFGVHPRLLLYMCVRVC